MKAAFACLLMVWAARAQAYRPFISTDADVVARRRTEVELGVFGLEHASGGASPRAPELRLNYGVWERVEAVGEFVALYPRDGSARLAEGALSLKAVTREGELQGKSGASLALESSALTPDTGGESRKWGFEQTAIASRTLGPLLWHFNLGGGWERVSSLPFGAWGVIAERALLKGVRLVGELAGQSAPGRTPDNSGLLGFLWETPWRDLRADIGYRRGVSAAASSWALTTGITYAFGPGTGR